jgi:hypothetical protein
LEEDLLPALAEGGLEAGLAGPVDDPVPLDGPVDREGEGGQAGRVEGAELAGQGDRAADGEAVVLGQAADHGADQGVGPDRIGQVATEGLGGQGAEHGLLAADAAEVGAGSACQRPALSWYWR